MAVFAVAGGLCALSAQAATAATNNWYVAPTGSNTANACTNPHAPCKTITYALSEQAASLTSGTIHVAAGTYTEQLSITSVNDNVSIVGAGPSTVVQPPSSGLASDTDTDSSNPQYYVIDVAPGTTGVGLSDLTVDGLNGIAFLGTDGNGCAQDYVGIYYHSASGSISDVSVEGIDMPSDLFGCQGGLGIYVNSTAPTAVAMTGISMVSATASTTTTADLPAGTYSNDIVPVKKIPKHFFGGEVSVNGFILSASRDGKHALFISGVTPVNSPKGSVVRFDVTTPAYDKNGITCDDVDTTCSITHSTISGAGPTNGIGQNGIQAFGASATITDNTISDNTYTGGGGSGNAASGILLLNGATFDVTGNTVSDSDVNVYAGEVPSFGLLAPEGVWTIANNTVSGATSEGASAGEDGYGEGIQLDSTTGTVNVTGNDVSSSAQANVLLTGATGATIGGTGSGQGNTITGGDVGIVVGGPGSAINASTGNTITANKVSGVEVGVLVQGAYAPAEFGGSNPGAATSNVFSENNWSGTIINAVDFSGWNGSTPPPSPMANTWGTPIADSCDPTAGGSAFLNTEAGGPYFYAC